MKERLIATALIVVAWFGLEFVIHGQLLMDQYSATASLWRPMAEMKNGLGMIANILVALTFVLTYCNLVQNKSLERGLRLGLLVGVIVGIGAASSYVWMPITTTIAAGWFLAKLVNFVVAGFIVGKVVTHELTS